MTTWEFRSKDHIKWLEASCDVCHTSAKIASPRATLWHCGKREAASARIARAYYEGDLIPSA